LCCTEVNRQVDAAHARHHDIADEEIEPIVLPESAHYLLEASISARIVRGALNGVVDAAKSLIGRTDARKFPIQIDLPPIQTSRVVRFLLG
jgi:hypothetical protein